MGKIKFQTYIGGYTVVRLFKIIAWVLCVVFWGSFVGCEAGGNSGIVDITDEFPISSKTQNALQIRLTDTGVSAVETVAEDILQTVFPSPMHVEVPPICGNTRRVCCGTQCELAIDLKRQYWDLPRVEIIPVNTSQNDAFQGVTGRIGLLLRAKIGTRWPFPASQRGPLGRWINCSIEINSAASGSPDVSIYTELILGQNQDGELHVTPSQATVWGLTENDLSISGALLCRLASEKDAAKEIMRGVADQVPTAVAGLLCQECSNSSDCGQNDYCSNEGICMKSGQDQCRQKTGIAKRLLGETLLKDASVIAPNGKHDIDVAISANGNASTANGSLGFFGNLGALPFSSVSTTSCVPPVSAPVVAAVSPILELLTNLHPVKATPYDVGVAIHRSAANRALWAAEQAGYLCLNIGQEQTPFLSSQVIGSVIPSLNDLTGGLDSPMELRVRPQQPPTVSFGAELPGANGQVDTAPPLLTVHLRDLDLGFYLMLDSGFVRVFTVTVDADVPVALDFDDEGNISPEFGDIAASLRNYRVTASELISETTEELEDVLPTLIKFAVANLGSELDVSFKLPQFQGLQVELGQGDILAVDNGSALALFGKMKKAIPGLSSKITNAESAKETK